MTREAGEDYASGRDGWASMRPGALIVMSPINWCQVRRIMEPDFTKHWVATVVQHHHRMEKLLAPEFRAPHLG